MVTQNEGLVIELFYRVTIPLVQNLPLTSKQQAKAEVLF